MENNGGHLYSSYSNRNRVTQNNNNGNWDIWELNNNTARYNNWQNSTAISAAATTTTTAGETPTISSFMFPHLQNLYHHQHHQYQAQLSLYGGEGFHPDPHLMCLKLGKRHYFEDTLTVDHDRQQVASLSSSVGKKGKPFYSVNVDGVSSLRVGSTSSSSSTAAGGVLSSATVPRCQVEGCQMVLVNAKDYHRRHKVCEMHSKAPKVIVLGLEQRFCQQCSRFHAVSEFDESKRSCRRRLAGHNERRRKSAHDSFSRNSCQEKLTGERYQYITTPTTGALSLLSSSSNKSSSECSWVSSSDLSSRSSAALRELIAEHRSAIFARQLFHLDHRTFHHNTYYNNNNTTNNDNGIQENFSDHQQASSHNNNSFLFSNHYNNSNNLILAADQPRNWDHRFHETGTQVTLDLMQTPSSAFGFLSSTMGKSNNNDTNSNSNNNNNINNNNNNKDDEDECSELWNTWANAHVV